MFVLQCGFYDTFIGKLIDNDIMASGLCDQFANCRCVTLAQKAIEIAKVAVEFIVFFRRKANNGMRAYALYFTF